ncbi:MAG TPA: carboxypeptidase regulatory-like domain-containing protein [Silvibacterium sp.]|nr:carboxypeptidase regulatory-like domain-containing protein [Silvibacterium sp.]
MKNVHPHRSGFATVKFFLGLSLAVLCALLLPGNLKAQSIVSGDIAGTVTDPTGAAVPNASVTVTSESTGQVKKVTSGSSGEFRVPLLSPGGYRIDASAAGFQTSSTTSTVQTGRISTVNVSLSVGQSATTVQVTAAAPLLHTEDAQISTSFSLQQIQNLPNPGNDLTFVAQTAPGAVMNTQGGYGNFSTNGLPGTSNTFTMNGGYEGDPYLNLNNSGATNLLLGNNDVDSVTVTTNAYDSAFGGLGGAQVNEMSRSGANAFHGNAIYWWNGRAMNANSFFNKQFGSPRGFDNANQWAAAVGGPIRRDKAFFFVDYEGTRVIIPERNPVFAPSPAWQAVILGPATTDPVYAPYGNLAANGLSAEAPLYQNIFNYYNNAPNFAAGSQDPADPDSWIFNGQGTNFAREWLITGRTDFNLTSADQLFVHFKVDKGVQPTETSFLNPIFDAQSPQPSYEGQLGETHTFSPSLTNQFLFSATYYRAIFTNTNGTKLASTIPFVLIPEGFAAGGDWDLTGNSSDWIGAADYAFPQGRNVTGYQFGDDFSLTRGNHTIKVGWTMRRDDITDYSSSEHNINFGGGESFILDQGMFAGGFQDEWREWFPQRLSQPVALYVMGGYAQDQWKVRPNFTLTAGLRLEHNSNPLCLTNCVSRLSDNFINLPTDPTTPYNQLISSGQRQAFHKDQPIAYEPRVGFSYQPTSKTTVRGGFGMFADYFPAQIMGSLMSNAPNVTDFRIFGVNLGGPTFLPIDPSQQGSGHALATLSNDIFQQQFANGGSYSTIRAAVLGQGGNFSSPSFTSVQQKIHLPTYEEWSLAVEREVTRNTVISLQYVGNRGYHEPVANTPNAFTQASVPDPANGVLSANATLPTAKPNPSFASVTEYYSGAVSNFNGLIATATSRMKWLSLQFNYAYGHALDEISNGGFDAFGVNPVGQINPNNLAQNYGNADYDTRHYISANYVINVPYWGGPHAITDNWQIAGTVFHNSGYPFSVFDASGNIVDGNAALAMQLDNNFNHHCGGDSHTITPCDFASHFAPSTDYGQQRRNQLYGPNYTDSDLDLSKGFKMPHWESSELKLGAQFYNVFNHPNFQIPLADVNDGSSDGLIYTNANTPTSILGAFLGGDASPRLIQLKASFNF